MVTRGAVLVTAFGVVASGALVAAMPAVADPPQHRVRYTLSATQPTKAVIYYREVQPPNFGEYSHNPYLYSPRADADVGPNRPWIFETTLADPEDWALVVAQKPAHQPELQAPGFVCELRVDDVVVSTDAGTKGVLCSLRTW
ncbi:hypothetical protein E2F47_02795 [Mycobacterium eburneum]|nr:hypothetical protein E2F47_02795 [Mycobacterium eburneum]